MVGSRVSLQVDEVTGSRWSAALNLLETGEAWIGLCDLVLSCDLAIDRTRRSLHVEFACRFDPFRGDGAVPDWLGEVADVELARARELIGTACDADPRFASLVAGSDLLYEFVHDYGLGTVLIASARSEGPLTWMQ